MSPFIRPLFCGAAFAAIALVSAGDARAQTCPAACPHVDILTLEGVVHEDAETGPVSGLAASGKPSRSKSFGEWVYELKLTRRQADDVAVANDLGCESVVTYSTSGDVIASGNSVAILSAEVVTELVRGARTLPLVDPHDEYAAAPTSAVIGETVETPNLTPLLLGVEEGDRLVVSGTAWAFAHALDSSGTATADFRMPFAGATGSPLFKICTP